jgi:putative transposase
LKYECVYINVFENGVQARKQIILLLIHYNQNRHHSTFNGKVHDEDYDKEKYYQWHSPDYNIRVAYHQSDK